MTPQPQQEYIITEDMLRYWKNQCVAEPAHTNTDECKACQYRGKGTREGCCDFDDTDMEKIFRSRPHTSTPNPCEEQGCTDTEQCDEICEHSRIYSPAWVKEHDTAIRNATLDKLTGVFGQSAFVCLEKTWVLGVIKSLRSEQP